MRLLVAMNDELVVASGPDGWSAGARLDGAGPLCLAADPTRPGVVYCGTGRRGVWRSEDAGATWHQRTDGIASDQVTAIAVGPDGVVYAGTEPSALYRSEDGGGRWRELPALRSLPSAPTWSFPPRPHTSHVRQVLPRGDHLVVCIEAGALVQSADAGATWERPDAGLGDLYLWGLAIDPGDPEVLVASASESPQLAHDPSRARSTVYRRAHGGDWAEVGEGLPDPAGCVAAVLAVNPAEAGVFYAASNRGGVHRSADGGQTWTRLPLPW